MNSTSTPKRLSCRITFMIGHIRIPLSACLALASALSLTVVGHAQDELSDLDEQLQSEFGDDLLEGLDDIPLNPDFGVGDADAQLWVEADEPDGSLVRDPGDLGGEMVREGFGHGSSIGPPRVGVGARFPRPWRP